MNRTKVRRALISVSDKTGLLELAAQLVSAGVEVIASGGTAAAIRAGGISVTAVEELTQSGEMLGGRVKTLHPAIYGPILADLGVAEHRQQLYDRGLAPIQLVIVNLYPFEAGLARGDLSDDELVELIDIGGPSMVRAAAKNHKWVGIVTSPDQYEEVAAAIAAGGLDDDLRRRLARAAFYRTASYDAAIVSWLEGLAGDVPERMVLAFDRVAELRYGENPHQAAGRVHREWQERLVGRDEAVPGQGDVLQQLPGHRSGVAVGERVHRTDDRDRQACQSVRRCQPRQCPGIVHYGMGM